jgi:hypothetical protein
VDIFPDEISKELECLDALLKSDRHQSLSDTLRLWRHYVGLLASRHPISQDDYVAILSTRDDIQDLLQRASLITGRILEALVSHDDSIFLSVTRNDDLRSFQAADREGRPGWWWNRIPEKFEEQ